MKNKLFIVFVILGSFSAQAQYQDLEGRYSIGLFKKIAKRWSIKLKEETRFNSNSLKLNEHLSDVQLKFKHKKWMHYKIGIRNYFKQSKDGYWNAAPRLNIDLILNKKLGNYSLSSRSRIQTSLNAENTIGRMHSNEAFLREKIMLKYNVKNKKIKPFIASELFIEDYFTFNQPEAKRPVKVNFESNKIRVKLGAEWRIYKHSLLDFSYGYQQELHQVFNQREFLIAVGYTYKFHKKK